MRPHQLPLWFQGTPGTPGTAGNSRQRESCPAFVDCIKAISEKRVAPHLSQCPRRHSQQEPKPPLSTLAPGILCRSCGRVRSSDWAGHEGLGHNA